MTGKALWAVGQTNINTCSVRTECQSMSLNKVVSKFVTEGLKYRILLRDTLTYFELDYKDARF